MSGPARPAACPRAGWAASNRWAPPSPAAIRSAATPPAASRRRPGLPQRQPLVDRRGNVLFFGLNTGVLAILLWAVTVAATLTGLVIGRRVARSATGLSEHFGVLQGALIGFMGLVLAFGLSLALGGTSPGGPTPSTRRTPSARRTCARRRWPSRCVRRRSTSSRATPRPASPSPRRLRAAPPRGGRPPPGPRANAGPGRRPGSPPARRPAPALPPPPWGPSTRRSPRN